MPVSNANSLDPEQMLCSTASVLGLHCLQMSLLWDASHKGVRVSVNLILRLAFQIPNNISWAASSRDGGGVGGTGGHFLYGAVQGCAAGIGILFKPEII